HKSARVVKNPACAATLIRLPEVKCRLDSRRTSTRVARPREESREIALRLRVRPEWRERLRRDHRAKLFNGRIGLLQTVEDARHAESRASFGDLRVGHAMRARRVE